MSQTELSTPSVSKFVCAQVRIIGLRPKQHQDARRTKRTYEYQTVRDASQPIPREKHTNIGEQKGDFTYRYTETSFIPFRRAAAPAAPLGRLAAAADAACASLILAAREALKTSASEASAAAEQSRHFFEASGLRAWVLVKLAAGSCCLHTLQERGPPLPSAPLPPPPALPLLDAALFRGFGGGREGGRERRHEATRARWVLRGKGLGKYHWL